VRPQRLGRTAAHCATPSVPSASKQTTVTIDEDRPLRFPETYQEPGARMLPLCAARIEDLGQGDFVKVDCAACLHVALLAPDFLLRLRAQPSHQGARRQTAGPAPGMRKERAGGGFDQVGAGEQVSRPLLPAPVKPSRRRRSFRPRRSALHLADRSPISAGHPRSTRPARLRASPPARQAERHSRTVLTLRCTAPDSPSQAVSRISRLRPFSAFAPLDHGSFLSLIR
jgi:hypothetical protein